MNNRTRFNIITSSILIILFTLCISLCLFINNILNKTSQSLLNSIYVIEFNINYENWDKSYSEICKLNDEWQKTSRVWNMLINHQEVDNISSNLKATTEYIKYKDKINSMANLSILKMYIEHIPILDKIDLQNIF